MRRRSYGQGAASADKLMLIKDLTGTFNQIGYSGGASSEIPIEACLSQGRSFLFAGDLIRDLNGGVKIRIMI